MAAMSPKHEPWFKPRADEDADEELINWLGGGGKPPEPQKQSSGWGCFSIAAPVAVLVAAVILVLG